MENEIKDETQVESAENIDSTNDEQETSEEVDNTPTVEDYNKLQQKNKELYERAKKAEAIAKAKKEAPLLKETNETQSLTRDEAILYAKGYTDEEVDLANRLSKLNGTTPLKAVEDDIFKAKHSARLKKERSEQASLSPSSSGGFKSDKPLGKMTKEEHEAYYRKVVGS